jgi:hypothetical protein
MSLSPDHSCVLSEKELAVDAESGNGDEELRAERNMPPLAGPGGAPIMLQNSYGTVFGIPPDHAIHQDVLFEMPPSISNEQDLSAATESEHGNDTDTILTDSTIGRGAASVLESTVGDQATSRDVVTHTILHRWQQQQQQSILDGRQHNQETVKSMEQEADLTPLSQNVKENDELSASGSIYASGDDDVDDDEDVPPRTPIELQNRYVGAHGDINTTTLDVGVVEIVV